MTTDHRCLPTAYFDSVVTERSRMCSAQVAVGTIGDKSETIKSTAHCAIPTIHIKVRNINRLLAKLQKLSWLSLSKPSITSRINCDF